MLTSLSRLSLAFHSQTFIVYLLLQANAITMMTVDDFNTYVASVEASENYHRPLAYALGLRKKRGDVTLEVFYPHINYESAYGTAAVLQDVTDNRGHENGFQVISPDQLSTALQKFEAFRNDGKDHPNIDLLSFLSEARSAKESYHDLDVIVYYLYDKDQPVAGVEEGYFKVQCLSQLLVRPHGINCDGIFGKMHNIAWTNKGPILPRDLAAQKIKWSYAGEELVVSHVDKFPYMVNFHVPEGVRIVAGSKVRLGAHLSSGTTVMPAGFVNFNAGTLGNAMIEGRVSAGVVVGENSDIGGGASIMGTLSGGNKNVISIGKQCLLGANAGTGISLGDGCTVAAGVYITAASKVSLYDKNKQAINIHGDVVADGENVVKGMDLNGRDYMLYLLDSVTGKLVGRPNTKIIALNEKLHA